VGVNRIGAPATRATCHPDDRRFNTWFETWPALPERHPGALGTGDDDRHRTASLIAAFALSPFIGGASCRLDEASSR